MIKIIILLSVFLAIAIILIIGELFYKAFKAIQRSSVKKYTVYYRKPSQSTLVSFYRTIKATSKRKAVHKLHELEKCVYVTEVEHG